MKFISHHDLEAWLRRLSDDRTLFAPVDNGGVLLYQAIENLDEIVWNFSRPVKSIKELFFPQTERLMVIKQNGGGVTIEEELPKEKSIIFGVRSCDAHGMLTLDSMFINTEPIDNYYSARRENSILIGLTCNEMLDTCFCTSMGGAPDDPTGMDLMLTELDDGFLIEVISDKGEALVTNLKLEATSIDKPDFVSKEGVSIPSPNVLDQAYKSKIWAQHADRCMSCRICAYICPTCRCFDIRDETMASSNGDSLSERIRCWDSCGGNAYRQIAGGHNPRGIKADRLRNRVMCKLYYFSEQYGPTACTGCGRCIQACPVNIDIIEIMDVLVEGGSR
jgi:ferredoxin